MEIGPGKPAPGESSFAASEPAPDPALARRSLCHGLMLRAMGRPVEAADAFQQAIAQGGDHDLNAYYLASLGGHPVPSASPRPYVERLFDDHAAHFEEQLAALDYRAPRVLAEGLQHLGLARCASALDMGCGTGLCGPLIKCMAERVDGVDLSAAMLARARALGVYDRLEHADLVHYLQHTPRRYDLVICADVFVYIGAVDEAFAGVARVLEPGGVFCFSVEHADDDVDFELRPTLRYAQSARYVCALAARTGFAIERRRTEPTRNDGGRPIAGLYVWLRKARP